MSLKSRFFKRDITDDSPTAKMKQLLELTRRNEDKGRPPILLFAIGDGNAVSMQVVLTDVSDIQYSPPNFLGDVKHVTFSLQMRKFTPFSLSEKQVTSTRYHRAKDGEYYELIAQAEYGNALFGDVIRKLPEQNGKALLQAGDIVKLPSAAGVRSMQITQTSVALKGSFSQKNTAQKALRLEVLDRINKPYNSFVFTPSNTTFPTITGENVFDESFDESFE